MLHRESADFGPVAFFKAQQQAFANTLRTRKGDASLIDALLTQAYESFERNVAIQAEGMPELDCHKGCATCCTLRVTATAPELLMISRYIRWIADKLRAAIGVDLIERILAADEKTRGLDERQRVKLRLRCPYIHKGACLIYQVRPLACRGHASYSAKACAHAASGKTEEIPFSGPHMTVRSLVQNAMQSALRSAGLCFGLYELNHGLSIALQHEGLEQAWLDGKDDAFAAAAVQELSTEEMAQTYDAIRDL